MTGDRRLIVLFGAAVRADGTPSPTLARRIALAEATARDHADIDLFCSGGVGAHGPSEASVMRRALLPRIAPARIHMDEASRDTLQSVAAATTFARMHGYARCLVCSDGYHQPRIRLLFALFGMPSEAIAMAHAGGARYLTKMRLREAAALPYDLIAGTWYVLRRGRP